MLRFKVVCVVLVCIVASVYAFPKTEHVYWVYFRDKGIAPSQFLPGTDLYAKTFVSISPQALKRRPAATPVTIDDVPVHIPYIESLRSQGLYIRAVSKWLNGVTVTLSSDQVPVIRSLPFVDRVELAAYSSAHDAAQIPSTVLLPQAFSLAASQSPQALPVPCGYNTIIDHYGFSYWHLSRIGITALHAMGFDATGIVLGFIDTGFNPDGMRTLRDADIRGRYDFVYDDTVVHDDSNDPVPATDDHGSVSLSTGVGFYPDSLMSPAYNASVYLAKTEDLRSETPAEEGHFVEALEWFEAQGVKIVSSSLGYRNYDSGYQSITYKMLDGNTTAAARGALKAARNGMLVATSAGNDGDKPLQFIMTPADADSILAVGATHEDDRLAAFTSHGPTSDGRTKPDILAPGAGIISMGRFDNIKAVGGTSFATPLVSGACALIMQAHPEASAQAVRSAVLATGRKDSVSGSLQGYGRINAYAAALHLGTIISPHRQWREDSIHHVCVGLAANNGIQSPKVVYAIGDSVFSHVLPLDLVTDSLIYSATFPEIQKGKHIRYYIETQDGADTVTRSPRNAPLTFYEFNIGDTTIVDSTLSVATGNHHLVQVFPNPAREKFSVVSSYDEPIHYQLVDVSGKTILGFATSPGIPRVDVRFGDLPVGVYLLRGQINDGKVILQQTIVRLQ